LIDLASTPSPTASPTSPSSNNISFEQFRQLINKYNINILPLSTDLAQSQKSLETLLSDLVNLGHMKETLAQQQLMAEQQEAGNSRPYLLTWQFWASRFSLTAVKHLIAGGVAGAVSRTVVSPLERMKILFQVRVDLSNESRRIIVQLTLISSFVSIAHKYMLGSRTW